MATTANGAQWDAMNHASKENLLRVVRDEAERMLELAAPPEHWQAPTASGHWRVRDIVGHMVDVTEGYLEAFRTTTTWRCGISSTSSIR